MKYLGTDPTDVTEFDDDKLQSNIALLGFKTAVNGSLAKYNLQDQIIDEYTDATGVDASASTNERLTSGYYEGTASGSVTASSTGSVASGGAVDGDYTWYKWTTTQSDGTFTTDTAQDMEYLVIAGGGGGGGRHYAGGGGAGGYRTATGFSVAAGVITGITVGAGGTGGATGSSGTDGSNSAFSTITSTGGGGGGYNTDGRAGGSGGGAGGTTNSGGAASPAGQGNAGGDNAASGNYGGGGGGAGAVGQTATTSRGGDGGAGTSSSIDATPTVRGGGGGGAEHWDYNAPGDGGTGGGGQGGGNGVPVGAGTANTGGGGGGADSPAHGGGVGGAGGSGIVILRRLTIGTTSGGDLTLQSTANTASSAATKADLIMLMENGEGTATINTDIKGYVSANGGSNWTEGTLVDEGTWGTNKKILAFHDAAVTSGTDMRYKITTHNQSNGSKETYIHATSLGWKAA